MESLLTDIWIYMDVYYGSCNLSGGDEICPFGSDWSHYSYFEVFYGRFVWDCELYLYL